MHLQLNHNDIPLGETLSIEINGGDFAVRRQGGQTGEFFCADTVTNLLRPTDPKPSDEAVVTNLLRPEKPPPDRLNLSFDGIAVFESGGRSVGGTKLSDTEHQFVAALHFAGTIGLPINEICEMVMKWNDGADEDTMRVIKWRIEQRFKEGKIPFIITSEEREVVEKRRTLQKKFFFLVRVSP